MPTPRAIRYLALAALVLLPACQMTVEIGTKVRADGAGVFSVQVALDKELVQGLGSPTLGTDGLAALSGFFDCLSGRGWDVKRSAPAGGLRLAASRPFEDRPGFGRVLASLRCSSGTEERLRVENLFRVDLDYGVSRSLMRETAYFKGSVDLGSELQLDAASRSQLATVRDLGILKVRVAVELPGAISIVRGDGVAAGGRAVWRPELAQKLAFEGRSSGLRVGVLMAFALPLLAALGGLVWWLAGRRRGRAAGDRPSADGLDPHLAQ